MQKDASPRQGQAYAIEKGNFGSLSAIFNSHRPSVLAVAVLAAVAAIAFSGCSRRPGPEPSPAASLTVDPSTAASITGTVVFNGQPPVLQPIDMDTDPACAKTHSAHVFPPEVVTDKDGGLANVVVFVKSGLDNYRFETPKDAVVLDQKGCMYEPHVLALMVNQQLEIRNDDATTHNVRSMPKINDGWNKAERADGPPIEATFARPELAIPFMCNIHPWMRSYVFVFSHPYYAVTSTTGAFSLRGLPPGAYTIEAWQEKYGVLDQLVTLAPRESKVLKFTFNAK